jgi:translation initiation factor IF-1
MTQQSLLFQGTADESFKGGMFKVSLDNGHRVIGHLSGKMRRNHIRIIPGDRVQIELSEYDLTRGRITYRYK